MVAAALAVEYVDELVDGTKGAALPLIKADLHLTYGQIGLLAAVPLLAGSLLELPLGLIADGGRRRSRIVVAGGVLFIASLAAVSLVPSFGLLLLALVAFFPASGAFVGLTQAALMDAAPGRHQQRMAAWNLAGSLGAVCGPLLLVVLLATGYGWRTGYLVLALGGVLALLGVWTVGPARQLAAGMPAAGDMAAGELNGDDQRGGEAPDEAPGEERRPRVREALAALGRGTTARWLVLLEISDLLLDVLTGFVGVYMVDVAHNSPAQAAIAVAVRLGGGLAGDALFVPLSRRVSGPVVLRVTALAAAMLYPAFLLVPSLPVKLIVLAALSLTTACWYPVIQAGLYSSLPGRSGIAVFLSSAASLAGAAGPLVVGFVAQRAGLPWALAGLAAAPLAVLAVAPRRAGPGDRGAARRLS